LSRPCREHTGFLTGTVKRKDLSKDDFCLHVPRFDAEACHLVISLVLCLC
jgi:hypothetical protein